MTCRFRCKLCGGRFDADVSNLKPGQVGAMRCPTCWVFPIFVRRPKR